MISWKRAVLLGLASWLIPIVLSFLVFPLKRQNPPLFETSMALIVLVTAGALFPVYFRGRTVTAPEGLSVGVVWLVVNGPMRMPVSAYYSEIGLSDLAFPAFGFRASRLGRP